ncbi:LysR family transcriptional regulator [Pantoea sp. A4]|uniref:LysR family transcriptional regulator n=1 Tax=Pantoea sp. A4 TaxID=1225184 RepID=UPI00036B5666|nr:LysR family transcriptional regulator [Pantoea sp. A4]
MDFRDLNYFATVAELGHLGRAAEKLCRTQSALSKCIKRLEEELGTQLFSRSGRNIVLTPAGAVLLERAKVLQRGVEESKRQIQDFARGVRGHVRLGVSSTMAELLLPAVTAEFMRTAPAVTLSLTLGMNDHLRNLLHAGHIDLMLGPLTDDDPLFTAYPLIDDEVVIVAGPEHPIFQQPATIAKLEGQRWVLAPNPVATRRWLNGLLEQHGLPPAHVQIETSSILLVPQLISRNHLLSVLSRRNLGPGRPGHPLREVPIAGAVMQRTFGVLYREETLLTPPVLCLLNILRSGASVT